MKKGFTLIELIVVIAIIAVLAAIIAPNAFKAIEKAKISSTIEDYRSIKTGAMAFYSDTGQWPAACAGVPSTCGTVAGGFVVQPTAAVPVAGWDGPYLEKWPLTTKWAGTYNWLVGTDSTAAVGGYNWDNAASTPEVRVLSISAASTIPILAVQRIETQQDGTSAPGATEITGSIRYGAPGTDDLYFLVSF